MNKIEEIEKKYVKILMNTGEVLPKVIFQFSDGTIDIKDIKIDNDNDKKDLIISFIRKKVIAENIQNYFIIMEVWMGNNINIRPKEDNNRKEALLIAEYRKDIKNKTIIQIFTRDHGKIILEDRVVLSNENEQRSVWNVYIEDCMDEIIEKLKKENK